MSTPERSSQFRTGRASRRSQLQMSGIRSPRRSYSRRAEFVAPRRRNWRCRSRVAGPADVLEVARQPNNTSKLTKRPRSAFGLIAAGIELGLLSSPAHAQQCEPAGAVVEVRAIVAGSDILTVSYTLVNNTRSSLVWISIGSGGPERTRLVPQQTPVVTSAPRDGTGPWCIPRRLPTCISGGKRRTSLLRSHPARRRVGSWRGWQARLPCRPASGEWTGAWSDPSILETCHSRWAAPGSSAGGEGSGECVGRRGSELLCLTMGAAAAA